MGEIGAPTLLMVGDEDFSALIDRHEYLSEEMPNAFAAVLEGAAHIPSVERPDVVNTMLIEFLDAIEGGDDEGEHGDEEE
jgi:pimeloyl-ACP methyl ester carboxylesterase